MPVSRNRWVHAFALLVMLAGFGCAKKDSSGEGPALVSFERNREVLLASPPTRRYSNANGLGWIEEWQIIEVIQQELIKTPGGHRECRCTVKFRVKRWDVQNNEKIEPPIERVESEERMIPVA